MKKKPRKGKKLEKGKRLGKPTEKNALKKNP